ncbi:FAD-binding domain-containing protein [Trichodelitschia bisporula]|uniref:FAD-binding domain-containing protein n=1 Tax=Trichodelitschia bisporula TaxID=703511 RepID=A0A6G1HMX7_9PEZI|nr:FAD-binding domain-containing protein [Trichodelitschia bisporula]
MAPISRLSLLSLLSLATAELTKVSTPVNVLAAEALLAEAAPVAASPSVTATCKDLEKAVPGQVQYSTGPLYAQETKNYWSAALWEEKPFCILFPKEPEHVASAVKVLNTHKGVKFAVKSGGHDPNPGHATARDSVLISMLLMNGTTYDPAKKVAYVKPGGTWNDVIGVLDKQGVTVVGGRLGPVGLGGYLVQGGLSFLSAQYGMAADNVLNFETVMANGSIVNINAQTDRDLLIAMRGSGNQFGIVTKFTIQTHPIGKVWGGYKIYLGSSNNKAVFAGLHDFIANNKDPKAAVIVNTNQMIGMSVYMVFYFYDGPTPPKGTFGKLEDIKATLDMCKSRTYADLLQFNGQGVAGLGQRTSFRSVTLPFLPGHADWYGEIEKTWWDITASFVKSHLTGGATIAFQPFTKAIASASEKRGGNTMGLKASDPHRFILEINFLWGNKTDDQLIWSMGKQLTDKIAAQVKGFNGAKYVNTAGVAAAQSYTPYFMNDASDDQPVTGSYRDGARFAALQKMHDPQGLWKRVGGFKYD